MLELIFNCSAERNSTNFEIFILIEPIVKLRIEFKKFSNYDIISNAHEFLTEKFWIIFGPPCEQTIFKVLFEIYNFIEVFQLLFLS